MKGNQLRTCVECGEKMTLQSISRSFKVKGKEIEIKGINAYVCKECGEIVFTSEEAKMIESVINAVNENVKDESAVLNLSETAEFLRVSNQTIYNMIRSKRIKAYKVGREWRFLRADIMAYMDSGINDSLLAAKGGQASEHDLRVIQEEIRKRTSIDE